MRTYRRAAAAWAQGRFAGELVPVAVPQRKGEAVVVDRDEGVHFYVQPGDVFSWPADMGWIAGSLVLCRALLRGATLVCYDGAPDYPDWGRACRAWWSATASPTSARRRR